MLKVTSQDFQRNTGQYQDQALKESVMITRYGREHLVLIGAAEYKALRKRARIVLGVEDLSEKDIEMISSASMSSEHDYLNDELK
ncbi:MAG TPA: type II toxin-antitoxin system prevent-host-death family antitoxin [Gammaproteobacteria bacterium]|nr:type II toxin-antitoxin system prevent-host-death family antitoxin [Gammaproteobacteria bacterium]